MSGTPQQHVPISIREVSKTYDNHFNAVKTVSFDIQKGDFTVLLGLNGAGKTSLINMITGLNHITSGFIHIFGDDVVTNPYAAKRHMGIMPQEINFNQFSRIVDALVFHGGYYGIPKDVVLQRATPLLRKAKLLSKSHLPVGSLSGGMKRILMLIRALIQKPRILILDEPTANLDIEIRKTIWEILREEHRQGMTTLLTTHNLEEAQLLCTNVVILHHGKLMMDQSIEEAIQNLEEKFYSIRFKQAVHQKDIDRYSTYRAEKVSEKEAIFCIRRDQDIGTLVHQLHEAKLSLDHIAPSTHQLEQILHQATL